MTITRDILSSLYRQGKSMNEIASMLHCSPNTVVYWMNKFDMKRRSRSDALYIKANPNGDPFHIKTHLTAPEKMLFGLGIGIYWGEGNKATPNTVRVTNTDPAMIRVFRDFLLTLCQVHPDKIRYSLVTFKDTPPEDARRYWSTQLEISADKFGTIVSIPPQGKGTYRKKSLFGVCTMTVSNTKLKRWIMNQLSEIKNARLV